MLTKEAAQHVVYEIMKLYPDAVPTDALSKSFSIVDGRYIECSSD